MRKRPRAFAYWVLGASLAFALSGCQSGPEPATPRKEVDRIGTGDSLPKIVLTDARGNRFDLNKAVSQKPTVLIVYRGGWCPYCNRHLAELRDIEPELKKLGFRILAVSPDRPEKLRETMEKQDLNYRLLSDSSMAAAKALGLAFRVPDETFLKYKNSYDIDLEDASGRTHHLLPVPAALVIDRKGVIRFAYVNPDYKSRVDPGKLLEAAKAATK